MSNILVLGLCIFLLLAVIYISIKPISMGIEARRNIKEENSSDDLDIEDVSKEQDFMEKKDFSNISEEIVKLSELKNKGLLTQEEFEKAKQKLLS